MQHRLLMATVALVLVLAACGGTDTGAEGTEAPDTPTDTAAPAGTEAPTEEATTDEEPPAETVAPAAVTPEVGEMGSFTVDGMEFAVNLLNRCIPFSGSDDDLDLQALAQGQGAKLNLYLTGDWVEASVDGSTLDTEFGSIAWSADQVEDSTISGDRWTGSATMEDAYGTGDTVDVTWDVMIPDEVNDCSL